MSRLEQLIKELCPNGVKYKALKDVCTFKQGTSITKKDIIDGDIPVVAGGQEPAYYCNKANRDGETIVISSSGAYAGYVSYWDKPIFVSDAFTVRPNNLLATKYVYYFLANKQSRIYSLQKGAGVPHVYSSDIAFLKIPLPPLPVQQEIVRILDNFTELATELTVELEVRKKQYKYYRDLLLNPDNKLFTTTQLITINDCVEQVEKISWAKSKEKNYYYIDLASVSRETQRVVKAQVINSETAPSRAQQIVKERDVIFGTTRPLLKRYCLIDGKYNNQICSTGFCVLRAKTDLVIPEWIFHHIASTAFYDHVEKHQRGGSYPAISDADVKSFRIPIPSLGEQKRIVSILDRFDTLTNDTSIGIPAEIEARQKQYEYYRGKLLDFKEVK